MNISIVITAYNKGHLLIDAVDSALNLLTDNDEVVIVDDCSTDTESINCIKNLTQKYTSNSNISFYATDVNLGAAGAKNYGINVSKGEIIVLLDADDELVLKSFDIIRDVFSIKDVSFAYGDYIKENLDTGYSENVNCSIITDNGYLNPKKVANNWILLGSSPFRKSAFKSLGGYDEFNPVSDDVDLLRRAIIGGLKFRYIDDTIYKWNVSSSGVNSSYTLESSAFSFFRNAEFFYKYSDSSKFLLLFIKQIMKLIIIKLRK
jgi:glycosyltransferase involved in cell wall biosynthesis